MLRRLANQVQGLMARSGAMLPDDDGEPAAIGFVERLRDARRRDDGPDRPEAFGLRQLLATRALGGAAVVDAPAFLRDERATVLPTERMDVDGRPQPLDEAFFARDRYRLPELTGFADAAFVEIAFRCVLKRRADPAGFGNFVRGLRTGSLDRIDVLRGLAGSGEGRRAGVTIDGLARVAFWRRAGRAPVAGPVVRWMLAFVRLPRAAREQRTFQAQTLAWQQRQAVDVQAIRLELERLKVAVAALDDADGEIAATVADLTDRLRESDAARSSDANPADGRPASPRVRDERPSPFDRAGPDDRTPP